MLNLQFVAFVAAVVVVVVGPPAVVIVAVAVPIVVFVAISPPCYSRQQCVEIVYRECGEVTRPVQCRPHQLRVPFQPRIHR